jgi:diamine N-acetyltransferase
MSSITISKIPPEAADALVTISHLCFLSAYAGQIDPQEALDYLSSTHSKDQLHKELLQPDIDYFFAFHQEKIAGFCMLKPNQTHVRLNNEPAVQLNRIYLLPEYWGKGIGEQLLLFSENYARQHQASWLWLQVWQENKRAIHFYEKKGFKPFGFMDFYLGNTVHADWIMRKPIEPIVS